ncbi:MAG TPA: nickel pincer cofactor biosynthesis protein LarC [Actinomycetota bacterium]|nr:nickel pincer cofactor biosynthesis protein LarC [Actinomycetota bacterium]
MTTVAFFDCFSGISGDMVLGAMVDAGVPLEAIASPLAKLPIESFELEPVRVERLGISATAIRVRAEDGGVARTYTSVRAMLEEAALPARSKALALKIFERLGRAEATVHGKDIAHVRFHELGAVDTIVDIVGAALALEHLGVERVHASAVATGMGMMRTDHGVYPIPGPAVLELLKDVPIYSRGIPNELVTPTGAAILAATAQSFGDIPPMRVSTVGYGAGTRELDIPNVLRMLVGEAMEDDSVFGPVPAVMLEANIDDMNPELYEYVLERLFSAGAQDAWVTPITMKRGRPAATLHVLCGPGDEISCRDVIFSETTTLGMRRSPVEKWTLPREIITVEIDGGSVRVKVARSAGGSITGIAPEYADCAALARETGRPLKQVFTEAHAAAERRLHEALR